MGKMLRVVLAGNPNSGKTSLFNALTGLRQKVANFPGITVDKKIGFTTLEGSQKAQIIDLPGAYSLFPKSLDEAVPFEIITNPEHKDYPDQIVYIADASNLKRNMMFLTQILDLGIPTILVLNMTDQAEKQGIHINVEKLEMELGVEIVTTNARKRTGIDKVKEALTRNSGINSRKFYSFDEITAKMLDEVGSKINVNEPYLAFVHSHIPGNESIMPVQLKAEVEDILAKYKVDKGKNRREDVLYRYKHIDRILSESVKRNGREEVEKFSSGLDKVLTHKIFGYVIFFIILLLIFQAIFSWATYPMDWIDAGFGWLGSVITAALPAGFISDLLVNGILSGLSGVVIFIPQIAILYFFIAIMEDTGYLSRVSFLMDNIMRKFGMSGKSLVPLMSGTACAIPAIMATRNIENWRDRMVTLMVTPLMSCSARLPVYILLIGLVIPESSFWGFVSIQAIFLMGLYVLGFVAAISAAIILKYTLKTDQKNFFMLELPVYRMPRWSNVLFTSYDRAKSFVVEAGKIIIAISIVLWVLATFGPPEKMADINRRYSETTANGEDGDMLRKMEAEKLEASFAGMLGQVIEPVIRPLGYDWKIGIALITSFAAREVFVGTMATIYGVEQGDESAGFSGLKAKLLAEKHPDTGKPVYTLATVLSLMIFYAFAMQCMSTLAVTKKETRSWKWPAIQFVAFTGAAYIFSLIIFQVFG